MASITPTAAPALLAAANATAPASSAWIAGTIMNIVGSTAINFGTNVMKNGHLKADLYAEDPTQPPPPPWLWPVGVTIFAAGNILNFVSFGFAAQSLLSAIGSVQFVANVVFAYLLLGEEITRRILEGTGLIVLGNVFTLMFANHDSRHYTVDELSAMYFDTPFLAYLTVLFTAVFGIQLGYRHLKALAREGREPAKVRRLLPLCFAAISGMIGSLSVLLAKSCSQLLRMTIAGDNQFLHPFTYLVLVGWVFLMVFWMERLNTGLRRFPSMVIVPALQVFWTVHSIIAGGIYFHEFETFSRSQSIGFLVGVIMILYGVRHLSNRSGDDDEEADPEKDSAMDSLLHSGDAAGDGDQDAELSLFDDDGESVVGRQQRAVSLSTGIAMPVFGNQQPLSEAIAFGDEYDAERGIPRRAASDRSDSVVRGDLTQARSDDARSLISHLEVLEPLASFGSSRHGISKRRTLLSTSLMARQASRRSRRDTGSASGPPTPLRPLPEISSPQVEAPLRMPSPSSAQVFTKEDI